MADQNEYDDYLARAAIERQLAETARDKSDAEAHREAGLRYENLAKKIALARDLSAAGRS